MTGDQSRALIVGDRVRWNNDTNDQGTVSEKNWAGVIVKWDNRGEQAILHNDMILVERATTKLMYVHLTFIPIPGVWAGGLIR